MRRGVRESGGLRAIKCAGAHETEFAARACQSAKSDSPSRRSHKGATTLALVKPSHPTPARLRAALAHKAPVQERAAIAAPESAGQSVKGSYSLFPADNDRIAAIRAALAEKGREITASHAIRLALRAVEIDAAKLAKLLDEMQSEDGRTRRHAKPK